MDVLVIDDESSVGTLLRFNLRQRGFDVDTAASAAEGYDGDEWYNGEEDDTCTQP